GDRTPRVRLAPVDRRLQLAWCRARAESTLARRTPGWEVGTGLRRMRILFMHHFPLELGETGHLVERWARALTAAGHDVQLLVVDDHAAKENAASVDRIVCRAG